MDKKSNFVPEDNTSPNLVYNTEGKLSAERSFKY